MKTNKRIEEYKEMINQAKRRIHKINKLKKHPDHYINKWRKEHEAYINIERKKQKRFKTS